MSILTDLAQIEKSLGILYSFGAADDEMTMEEARHLVALIQVDMAGYVEAIREETERAAGAELAAMRARADLADAKKQIQVLTGRTDAALDALDAARNEALNASVKVDDTIITGHIGRTACRIGTAMRALRGKDELVELRLANA